MTVYPIYSSMKPFCAKRSGATSAANPWIQVCPYISLTHRRIHLQEVHATGRNKVNNKYEKKRWPQMQTVMGNIHIHSTYSVGAESIYEIARAAAKSGLDFIIITDHRTLAHRPEEGYRDGVLVLCGSEVNYKQHQSLALGIKEEIPANDDNPQAVIDAVSAQRGLGIIAHPFEAGSPLVLDGIHYPWLDWQVSGFSGIE